MPSLCTALNVELAYELRTQEILHTVRPFVNSTPRSPTEVKHSMLHRTGFTQTEKTSGVHIRIYSGRLFQAASQFDKVEAVLSEIGFYAWLHAGNCVGRSE